MIKKGDLVTDGTATYVVIEESCSLEGFEDCVVMQIKNMIREQAGYKFIAHPKQLNVLLVDNVDLAA